MMTNIITAAIENFNPEIEELTASTLADMLGDEECFEGISRLELEELCEEALAARTAS